MQTNHERVLDAAKRLPPELPLSEFVERLAFIVRVRKEMEELAARAGERSRDVQTGATVARGCLASFDHLDPGMSLQEFRYRLDGLDQLARSAQDIAAGRTISNDEVFRRLAARRAARKRKRPSKKSGRRRPNGSRK